MARGLWWCWVARGACTEPVVVDGVATGPGGGADLMAHLLVGPWWYSY